MRNGCNHLLEVINSSDLIISVEEHSIIGGFGSLLSETIAQNNCKIKFKPLALPNSFGPTGEYNYLLDHHGLSSEKIYSSISNILRQENLIQS